MSDRGSWNAFLSHPASGAGCEISGWNVGEEDFRMWDIRVECRRSRILDMLFGSLTKVHKPCYVIPTACHNPCSVALRWCVRTSFAGKTKPKLNLGWKCASTWQLRFFIPDTPCIPDLVMDSKELSSISDCFGDQKAIKRPKLNTIWLELIARVLNMLIGLKGDNYYSKVFKRVNYKLWNSTFWVVINDLVKYITF